MDPVYVDGLVSEILSQTDFGTVQLVKEFTVDIATNIRNHLGSLPSLPSIPTLSEINFNALPRSRQILINFIMMVLTYFVCRRYRINYLIFLFFAFIYFLYEYLDNECHRVSLFFFCKKCFPNSFVLMLCNIHGMNIFISTNTQ